MTFKIVISYMKITEFLFSYIKIIKLYKKTLNEKIHKKSIKEIGILNANNLLEVIKFHGDCLEKYLILV